MNKKYLIALSISSVLFSFSLGINQIISSSGEPGIKQALPSCVQPGCHKVSAPNELWGNLISISQKAGLLQIDTGQTIDVFFDESSKVSYWEQPLNKLSKGTPIKVVYTEKEGKRYASIISVKPPVKVPPEKIISLEEVKKLVEQKSVLIIDVRPPAKYAEGHIPGAINLPLAQFGKKLPEILKDKQALAVVYCEGPR
ncbi:rhodanese-like domain-containing protein [Thermodesulfobacterium sp. TA1]|uniref:rhodanese-like domain-containing protein n=1 Tax=Thermodesulfobacterium sp. TA1 TaxID=2234087 RepID=UPI001231DD92|nr:rhodanese-like domain-containing protein [Thermodesulfobacterium sp. TA1]QER42466.1 rhodanese-like domain-containing protein [Thermodesulfobacterium sp. TA1]